MKKKNDQTVFLKHDESIYENKRTWVVATRHAYDFIIWPVGLLFLQNNLHGHTVSAKYLRHVWHSLARLINVRYLVRCPFMVVSRTRWRQNPQVRSTPLQCWKSKTGTVECNNHASVYAMPELTGTVLEFALAFLEFHCEDIHVYWTFRHCLQKQKLKKEALLLQFATENPTGSHKMTAAKIEMV